MGTGHLQCFKHCRWCEKAYHASLPKFKDGFCSSRCKAAHDNAYYQYIAARKVKKATPKTDQKKPE